MIYEDDSTSIYDLTKLRIPIHGRIVIQRADIQDSRTGIQTIYEQYDPKTGEVIRTWILSHTFDA